MAADTRPYKSKEQDGQGNEVIIRDQQLVEQSTVTTMPSGACFETLDIDGRPVKIPRDNMMSIVLECMGIVLNDSSKNLGTNVNKALGLQGNTIGNVTVSDLASVLGDQTPIYENQTWDSLLILARALPAYKPQIVFVIGKIGEYGSTAGSVVILANRMTWQTVFLPNSCTVHGQVEGNIVSNKNGTEINTTPMTF